MSVLYGVDFEQGYVSGEDLDLARQAPPQAVTNELAARQQEKRQRRYAECLERIAAVVMTAETEADWEKLAQPSYGE